MLTFDLLLKALRPDSLTGKVKLVRHADSRWSLATLEETGHFEEYQSRQGKPWFQGATRIVSFISGGRTRSRFVGVFDLVGVRTGVPPLSPDYPFPDAPRESYKYELQKVDGLEALEDRLIVDWGAGTRSWVQWLRPKPVIEVLPQGYAREFPGYDDVVLSFREMNRIVDHPDANRVWQRMLRSAAGVYLILDRKSGSQYVGSAAGAGGLLGRWRTYAKSKHGNNTRLEELLRSDPQRYRQFTFSILRTLPRTMTKKEVVAVESVYKAKLGTRAFGLNGN